VFHHEFALVAGSTSFRKGSIKQAMKETIKPKIPHPTVDLFNFLASITHITEHITAVPRVKTIKEGELCGGISAGFL
jgi:hypothetical protein